ncbi:MAG: site-specific DNA-methyltransferase, partial [Gemmatimonadetes bacterium]|nr:site-specific DNA-methyltransferase [Gemmatimonadota bacterium]
AFFWEERNVWFSDVWLDVKGTTQGLVDAPTRERSAAFPFELAYRLVCMFSVKEDWVLDPFAGTGTTLAAALTAGRNSVGVEIDEALVRVAQNLLHSTRSDANEYNRARLARHAEWAAARTAESGPLKYASRHYGFPVMTAQEQDLLLNEVTEIAGEADGMTLVAQYNEESNGGFAAHWPVTPPDSQQTLLPLDS